LINKLSDKDQKDWKDFIEREEKIIDKEDENKQFIESNKIIEIDLHGFSLEHANRKIEEVIIKAYEKSVYKIIVVTGKGLHSENDKNPYVSKDLSILKYSVPEFIENNKTLMNLILEIKEAKVEDGGSGAFYLYLKRNKK
tara:strand:- start:83 stop:502 length:420 start_codon:yes stop_codon:yes gene_type:complete